jgi:SpoVK/Ycf46/Vps4 family AAA+-type ATPase
MDRPEQRITLYCLKNILSSAKLLENGFDRFRQWGVENAVWLFGKPLDEAIDAKIRMIDPDENGKPITPSCGKSYGSLCDKIAFNILRKWTALASPPDTLDGAGRIIAQADNIAESFLLSGAEREIIRFIVAGEAIQPVRDMIHPTFRESGFCQLSFWREETRIKLAALLKLRQNDIISAFGNKSGLKENGLIGFGSNGAMAYSSALRKVLFTPSLGILNVKEAVLTKAPAARLSAGAFNYIGDKYEFLKNLLKNALNKRESGVNILLYGKPGTGKTELAKTLCFELGAELFSVSESINVADDNGRVFEAAAAKTLLSNQTNTVLMFDEAEDVFLCHWQRKQSKMYLNRMLETNRTPVIWITNNHSGMDSAHLRRFSYALAMKVPPVEARMAIWEKMLKKNKIRMSTDEIKALTAAYELPPSFAESAVRAAKIVGDKTAVKLTLDSLMAAQNTAPKPPESGKKAPFNIELLNPDINLERLVAQISSKGMTKFSLCLYGPPGTGKSAFVRYLADIIKMPVFQKRVSDLQSMFVGQTELNIANAFQEAISENKFLVFDEADSFLQDRRLAVRSWEKTQVNEMLTWMESHPRPFACTTNLIEQLDKASLRRFTFKVKMGYMTKRQTALAFRHFFGVEREIPLEYLTPADYALAAQKADILGFESFEDIVELLRAESESKEEYKIKIGF